MKWAAGILILLCAAQATVARSYAQALDNSQENQEFYRFLLDDLPHVQCENISLFPEGIDTSPKLIPVNKTSCKKLLKKAVGDNGTIWPTKIPTEFEGNDALLNGVAGRFCRQLLKDNNIPLPPQGTANTGCLFENPATMDKNKFDLWNSTLGGTIPTPLTQRAVCTELPIKSISTMSNPKIFSALLKGMKPGSQWQDVKDHLARLGFREHQYDNREGLFKIHWLVLISSVEPDGDTLWPFPMLVVYKGNRDEGPKKSTCIGENSCSPPEYNTGNALSSGLCISSKGPGY